MAPARGDRKPCTLGASADPTGLWREQLLQVPPSMPPDGDRGWVCSGNPWHFQASGVPRLETTDNPALHPRWDDDGGSTAGNQSSDSQRTE